MAHASVAAPSTEIGTPGSQAPPTLQAKVARSTWKSAYECSEISTPRLDEITGDLDQ
ncbi:MAG: hypothetical protein M3541_15150 [Acidobacteriota bacterium]|nr:hypothetical protein [Acidobacteriota bacterium]MDQ3420086.1 hypothetical protein [Acidobacteriota bacterium]